MTGPTGHRETIGFSGHQTLSVRTRRLVRAALAQELSKHREFLAVTSLAAGGDQIFAECVVASGNQLMVVIPCERYERSFNSPSEILNYRQLLDSAIDTIQLPYLEPSEEAYWAAGQRIVDMADVLIAVWDGQPAGGLGGTADVVEYAMKHRKNVSLVWPRRARRG